MDRMGIALVCVAVLSVSGCSSEAKDGSAVRQESSALVNGYLDNGDPWVGMMLESGCTGTLVGRSTVITAAHCIPSNGVTQTFCSPTCNSVGCWGSPSTSRCMTGTAYIYPGFAGGYNSSGTDFDHDLAILTLNGDYYASFGIMPRQIGGPATTPAEGNPITLVGFGCDDPNYPYSNANPTAGYGFKRYGYNVVADVHSELIDFDDTSQAYLCPGDSGGPAFFGGTDCELGVMLGWQQSTIFDLDFELGRIDTKAWWIQSMSGDSTVHLCGEPVCGDGLCQSGEVCSNCPQDCGACPGCNPACGANKTCTSGACTCSYNQCGSTCCPAGYDFCCSGRCAKTCGAGCPC